MTQAVDFPCMIRIEEGEEHGTSKPWYMGDSVQVRAWGHHLRNKFGVPEHPQGRRNCVKGRGHVGLFNDKDGPWIVLSWKVVSDLDPTTHSMAVDEFEEGDWNLSWYAIDTGIPVDLLYDKTEDGTELPRWVRFKVLKKPIAQMFEVMGNPLGEASWLAAALSPRKSRGVMRFPTPDHLQVWIPV
jgi:hypothetical protein